MSNLARRWLGLSLTTLAPALRGLSDDPALTGPVQPIAGYLPPAMPTRIELHDAAAVIERAASNLRHVAGGTA